MRNKNHHNDVNDIVIGIRPVIEAINAGKDIDRVLIQNGLKSELFRELKVLLKTHEIPYKYVPQIKLNKVTRKNHQGIIAYISPVTFSKIENLIPEIFEEGRDPFILVLDKITDVRNFGALLRSAESAGVDTVLFPSQGAALLNSGTVKSSAGAIYNISLCRSDNLKDSINFLKNSGIKIAAATEKGANVYYKSDLRGPIAIIMGSEDTGVSGEYLKLSDERIAIPMVGKTESLNVSVAAGIILFEVLRQRTEK